MDFDYRVVQSINRKGIDHPVDYDVICHCIDFSTAVRVCDALNSTVQLEDDRYYMKFFVELYTSDETPF